MLGLLRGSLRREVIDERITSLSSTTAAALCAGDVLIDRNGT